MFTHILVPLDLTGKNDRARAIALETAQRDRARVTLLHVIQRIERLPAKELRAFYSDIRGRARRVLERAARPFHRAGVAVEPVVIVGETARDIVRHAEAAKADLIVMNSHRVDPGRSSERLGSTSYTVAILCRCDVMLVK